MDYKELGFSAVLLLFSGLAFTVWKWPQGKHFTYSQHVAVSKYSILYYVLLFSIFLPLIAAFLIGWFIPTFHLPQLFGTLVILSAVLQFACTLIPETGGWKTKAHRQLAAWSAVCLLPMLLLVLTQSSVSATGKVVTLLSTLVMATIIYTLAVGKGQHRHMLWLQTGYFAAFFVSIMFITYS